jgi:hypothetical protein
MKNPSPKLIITITDVLSVKYGNKEVENLPLTFKLTEGVYSIFSKELNSIGFSTISYDDAVSDLDEDIRVNFEYTSFIKNFLNNNGESN